MSSVRFGILGCSRVARSGLIPGIREAQRAEIVAIASRSEQRAAAWAREFAIPQSYGSYDEMLASDQLQAVYIGLPNHLHKRWVLAAAQAGKHVLCDKPLALNAAEAGEMAEACDSNGVLLMEGFMWRHHPRTTALLQLLRDGAIGKLHTVRYTFCLDMPSNDWRYDPACGGGALLDVGCYGVDTIRLLTGAEPEALHAVSRVGSTGIDLTCMATLRCPNNVLAHIECSFEPPFRYRVEVIGERAMILVTRDSLSGPPIQLWLVRDGVAAAVEIPAGDQFALMVDQFCQAILAGTPLQPPCENGLANARVLDGIAVAMA